MYDSNYSFFNDAICFIHLFCRIQTLEQKKYGLCFKRWNTFIMQKKRNNSCQCNFPSILRLSSTRNGKATKKDPKLQKRKENMEKICMWINGLKHGFYCGVVKKFWMKTMIFCHRKFFCNIFFLCTKFIA